MSIYLFHRLELVHFLIKTKSTGTPSKLAQRLQISERALYDFLDMMRDLGAPIAYCKQCRTYYYEEDVQFDIHFKKNTA